MRGVDQVVIADLFAVDVILPNQLHGAREHRDLRISGFILRRGGLRVVNAEPEQTLTNSKQPRVLIRRRRFIVVMAGIGELPAIIA
jgi:hypothetical protein